MMEDLNAWLIHPLTLGLAGVVVTAVLVTLEVLLRSLGELGNVRFQGLLEDHGNLLPMSPDTSLHLSRLIDVVRWLQILTVGLLWLVLLAHPGVGIVRGLLLCVLLPPALVALSRVSLGVLGEDQIALLLRLLRPLLWPLVALLVRHGPVPQPPPPSEEEEEEASDREIQAYVEAGQLAGIFEGEEGEFLQSLVDFFDTVVREVMTPRTEMVAIADTTTFDELVQTFASTHKSRIPVYHETIDSVVGVVHVKNLVVHHGNGDTPALTEIMHPVLVVPEAKPLGELLRDFQHHHQQLAIVVDEYGGTSGLVTLEDLLEEIVGEIQDEHDPREPPECQEIEPGVYRLQGRAPLETLEELFDVDVEQEDVDTVGGLVFSRHGTVPEAGVEVVDPGRALHFTVDDVVDRRIVSVTVRRLEARGPRPVNAT